MKEPHLKRKEKQAFLNRAILEREYDKEEFTEFISRKKSNAGDIDKWNAFELEQIVDEYKRIPDIYFSHNKFDGSSSIYENIAVKLEQNGYFVMEIKDLNKTVTRKFEDLDWVTKTLACEYPQIFIPNYPKVLNFGNIQNGKTSRIEFQLKCYLEYLFIFYYGVDSNPLKFFFCVSEEEFTLFRNVDSSDL